MLNIIKRIARYILKEELAYLHQCIDYPDGPEFIDERTEKEIEADYRQQHIEEENEYYGNDDESDWRRHLVTTAEEEEEAMLSEETYQQDMEQD